MKQPAIFFDRDNTLIACDGYLGDPSKVVLLEGAAEAVARARQLGFATVIVSNQSGVGRGLFAEEDVRAVNNRLDALLAADNSAAIIDRHEFCPFHPQATVEAYRQDSDLRKPRPGMILKAAEQLNLDLSRSWMIGDAPRDIEAGKSAGCRTILLVDPAVEPSAATRESSPIAPDFTVSTLEKAMEIIERDGRRETTDPSLQPSPPAVEAAPDSPARSTEAAIVSTAKLENLAGEILRELRRRGERDHSDFSVSKLMAGIVQILALAVLFYAYINRNDAALPASLLLAIMLQTLTIALLIMGRQK